MSAILKFDQKQLHFSKENYLNYTQKKIQVYMWQLHFPQGQTKTSSGPITLPVISVWATG